MPLDIDCPNPACQLPGRLPDEAAGQKARCQRCGHLFDVPAPQRPLADAPFVLTYRPFLSSVLGTLGVIVLAAGLVGAGIALQHDVTVPVEGVANQRVANVALMDSRRNWLLVSLFASGAGLALAMTSWRSRSE